MRNLHLSFGTLALIGLIIGTSFMPDSSVFMLASGDTATQVIRILLVGALLTHLLTTPPRHALLRGATGMIALGAIVYSIQLFFSYSSPILDSIILAQAATALGISTLEFEPEFDTESSSAAA